MKTDFYSDLGQLLVYISEVATAIRLNSAYNGNYKQMDQDQVSLDVMWLSDSLHNLDRLGHAIESGSPQEILDACKVEIDYYKKTILYSLHSNWKSDPNGSFQRHDHIIRPQQALDVFTSIHDKALALLGDN